MSENYCETHDIDVEQITGYDECPQCKRERRADDLEAELMARRSNPNMHNSIDAQANAIDHSRDPRR